MSLRVERDLACELESILCRAVGSDSTIHEGMPFRAIYGQNTRGHRREEGWSRRGTSGRFGEMHGRTYVIVLVS